MSNTVYIGVVDNYDSEFSSDRYAIVCSGDILDYRINIQKLARVGYKDEIFTREIRGLLDTEVAILRSRAFGIVERANRDGRELEVDDLDKLIG